MSWESDAIALIHADFDVRPRLVEAAMRKSDEFRELCEHYWACSSALDAWDRRDSTVAPERRAEYAEMLAELGREIQDWKKTLADSDPRSTGLIEEESHQASSLGKPKPKG